MPFRTKTSYSTSKGTIHIGRKGAETFEGKGNGPGGTKKIKARPPVITTVAPGGKITTQGFSSPRAATQAKRQARSSQRRVRRIQRQVAQAEGYHHRTQARASERLSQRPESPAKLASLGGSARDSARVAVKPPPPSYKPPKFQGQKTAGAPTLGSLRKAAKTGTLKLNKQGYATTPAVRKTAGALKRLESKARKSGGPLPGLTAQQSKVARTVLRRGVKAGATRKELLAAAETGLVEAPNFENPAGGDLDSEGWRQERTSIYGTGPQGPRNVKASADRFYKEIRTDAGASTAPTAGLAAQAAQGSAYPERYDERKPEANAIVKAFERGGLKPKQRAKLEATRQQARSLGLRTPGVRGPAVGPAPKKVVTRYKAARVAMKEIEGTPYIYGAGHGAIEDTPSALDCSGAVSYVLAKAGVLDAPLTSGAMGSVLKPGPGAITVFYNADHTFLYDAVKKEFWGTSVGDSGSGGLGPHPRPSDAYLAGYKVGHVPGLGKKQALQLGASGVPSTPSAFPGMTVSPSGTTATINSGAGSTREKAGFSKSPIKLTQTQKAHRTLKKLEQVGAGLSEKPSEGSESKASVLKELERRYGSKAA